MDNEFMKKTPEEKEVSNSGKLFANKAANKAIMISFGVLVAIIVGLAIFVNV